MAIPSIDINATIQNTCSKSSPPSNEQILPIFWRLICSPQQTLSTESERSLRDIYDVAVQNPTSLQAKKICLLYESLHNKELAQVLTAIPANERNAVIAHALLLFLPEVGSEEKLCILRTLARTPANERSPLCSLAINPKNKTRFGVGKVLEALSAVSVPDRHFDYVHDKIDGIIETLDQIPEQEKTLVIDSAKEDGEGDTIGVIRAVAAIPLPERFSTVRIASPALQGIMFEKHKVLEAITALPFGERKVVVDGALPFFNILRPSSEKCCIFKRIARIPTNELETITFLIEAIAGRIASSSHRDVAILEALCSIPSNKRREVVGDTINLIEPYKQSSHLPPYRNLCIDDRLIAGILSALARITPEEKAAIIPLVQETLKEIPSGEMLMAIADIPPRERKGVLVSAESSFTEYMTNLAKVDIIQSTYELTALD